MTKRELFMHAYERWVTDKDNTSLHVSHREQLWIDYYKARDAYLSYVETENYSYTLQPIKPVDYN